MIKQSETQLVKAIMDYLSLEKIFAWRNNTGAFKTERGDFMRFGSVGSPDIMFLRNGYFYGLEVKVGKNKQSPAQEQWEIGCRKNGGMYFVITELEQVVNMLKTL